MASGRAVTASSLLTAIRLPLRAETTRQSAPGHVRYHQPTEIKALIEAAQPCLRPVIALAVLTGMRRGEILALRWMDVDLGGGRLLLSQTKNGDGRIVYLNDRARTLIGSLAPGEAVERIFPYRPDWVRLAVRRLVAGLKVANFRFHDLHHCAASWMRMSGADIHTVVLILGHKDIRMAARYQHLSPACLAEAVGKLDGVFGVIWVLQQASRVPSAPPS